MVSRRGFLGALAAVLAVPKAVRKPVTKWKDWLWSLQVGHGTKIMTVEAAGPIREGAPVVMGADGRAREAIVNPETQARQLEAYKAWVKKARESAAETEKWIRSEFRL